MKKQGFSDIVMAMNANRSTPAGELKYKVQSLRHLTPSAFVLRFDRNNMEFLPGQHLTLGLLGDNQVREYSIYSSLNDPYLEVLIKEVENGLVSKKLKKVKAGDLLSVDGPFGFFTIDEDIANEEFLFVATGSGIAPFHCLAGSKPELNFTLLHGVKTSAEGYERTDYPKGKYKLCTSQESLGDFAGRVTDYLRKHPPSKKTQVYLCGNCDMIYEVYDLLTSQGISSDQIKTEVYF